MSTGFPGRGHYLLTATALTALAFYGSMVPLRYRPLGLSEAIRQFSRVPYLDIGVHWRADFVANLLLFVPLGYCWLGAVDADRTRRTAAVVATPLILGLLGLLVVLIEFTQLWFPPRTVSCNDMLAESVGACVGVALWFAVGRRASDWLRRFASGATATSDWRIKLLWLYTLGLLAYELLPLDVVISPEEIRSKIQEGRVLLIPFQARYHGVLDFAWQSVVDVALFIPVGVLARAAWTPICQDSFNDTSRQEGSRKLWRAGVAATLLAAMFETAQLFIFTRHVDSTDVLVRGLGGLIGAWLAIPIWRHLDEAQSARTSMDNSRRRRIAWGAGVTYTLTVVAAFWYPFDWVGNANQFWANLRGILDYPFMKYYWGQEFVSATNLLRGFMLFVPIGAMWRWGGQTQASMTPPPMIWLIVGVITIGLCIETGQAATTRGIADLTDLGMYLIGAIAGWKTLSRLLRHEASDAERTTQ